MWATSLMLYFCCYLSAAEVINYVKPNASSPEDCPGKPCLTLDGYIQQSSRYFTTGEKFLFLPGSHFLQTPLNLSAVSNISFRVENVSYTAVISTERVILENVTNFTVERLTFLINLTQSSSALVFIHCQEVSIAASSFQSMAGPPQSSAVLSTNSTISITNCVFQANASSYSGAVFAQLNSVLTVTKSHFNRHDGTAIIVRESKITLRDNLLENNHMRAVYCFACQLELVGFNTFENNSASNSDGGAIKVENGQLIATDSAVLSGNKAVKGGAISATNSKVRLQSGNILFQENVAEYIGGGMHVTTSEFNAPSSFTVNGMNLTFIGNMAKGIGGPTDICGVMCIAFKIIGFTQNSISAILVNNTGTNGGAFYMEKTGSFTLYSIFAENNTGGAVGIINAEAKFIGTNTFFRNSHLEKGALTIERESKVTFESDSRFDSNHAHGAIAVNKSNVSLFGRVWILNNVASSRNAGGINSGHSSLTFNGDVLFCNNSGENGGAVFTEWGHLEFKKDVKFIGNIARLGGALFASSTKMFVLTGSVSIFHSNSAMKGGAMYLRLGTIITFDWLVKIITINNTATEYGGAIYHKDSVTMTQCSNVSDILHTNQELALITIPKSFLQIDEDASGFPCPHIDSHNDSAGEDGDFLFGGLLDRTRLEDVPGSLPYDYFTSVCKTINVSSHLTEKNAITSDPFQLGFCDLKFQDIKVYRGQTFQLNMVALGQGKSKVATTVAAITNPSARIKLHQNFQKIPRYCSEVTYNLFSTEDHDTLTLFPEGPCLGEASIVINVTLLPCPNAFKLSSERCVCEDRLKKYNATCKIEDEVSIQKPEKANYWMNATYYEDGSYGGLILSSPCPAEYCTVERVNISLDNPDVQCTYNRSGVLCGRCTAGYSSMFGGYRCHNCSNIYLILMLPFALAGIILVAFLSFTRMTVATGTINSFILYANFVQVNKSIFLPFQEVDVLTVFIAWMNLDLGFETCFFRGMDVYIQTWLQYAFSAYVWSLISLIILISRYSITVSKLMGSNPVAVLATLLLMSYNKILNVVIDVFSSVDLEYPNEKRVTVWLKDGNLPFLKSKHLILSIFTILVALLIFLPYTIFLLLGHLLYRLRFRKCYRWLLVRIKPLLDSYYAPYKVKTRYWTGFFLLVRCTLYAIFSFESLGGSKYSLLAINVAFSAVGVLLWLNKGVYQHFYMNIIEVSVYMNLIMLSTAAITLTNATIEIVTHVLVGIVFIMAVGVTTYQVHYLYFAKSALWLKIKSKMAKYKKNPLKPVVQNTSEPSNTETSETTSDMREPLLEAI